MEKILRKNKLVVYKICVMSMVSSSKLKLGFLAKG